MSFAVLAGEIWYHQVSPHSSSLITVISALRVHAVTGRNWRLAVITLVLGLVPVGTNMVRYAPFRWCMSG